MSEVVLDASALLALLNNEPGADKVASLIDDAVISSANLAEVAGKLREAGMPAAACREAIDTLAIEVIVFTAELAYLAAELQTMTKPFGLSLGDRACLVTAKHLNRQAVTADRQWTKVKAGIKVVAIR